MINTYTNIAPYNYGLNIKMIAENDHCSMVEVAKFSNRELTIRYNVDTLTIVHEAFHITCDVMKRKNIRLCSRTEECFAYLLEDVTRMLIKKVAMMQQRFDNELKTNK